jgi:hypothetical protein
VTYFSLQFLLLGVLVYLFVPDSISHYMALLGGAQERALKGWDEVIAPVAPHVDREFFEHAVVGLLISGPPLLFAGMGHALAQRCARALSRRRFRALACGVSLGFASLALTLCLTPWPFCEEVPVDLEFHVVDAVSHRPIAGAFVRLTDAFSDLPDQVAPRALTDRDGRARLSGRFEARGRRSAFRTTATVSPWGRWLEVSAVRHCTRVVPLTALLSSSADAVQPGVSTIALAQGVTPERAFRRIAGLYRASGPYSGHAFEIEPDGRFAYEAWGCTFRSEDYGYVRFHDGEIEFVAIPQHAREINRPVSARYCVVEWGRRVYLSRADESCLEEFCYEALRPEPRAGDERLFGPSALLRDSDCDKRLTGLPRLPAKVWVKFAIDALVRAREGDGQGLAIPAVAL